MKNFLIIIESYINRAYLNSLLVFSICVVLLRLILFNAPGNVLFFTIVIFLIMASLQIMALLFYIIYYLYFPEKLNRDNKYRLFYYFIVLLILIMGICFFTDNIFWGRLSAAIFILSVIIYVPISMSYLIKKKGK